NTNGGSVNVTGAGNVTSRLTGGAGAVGKALPAGALALGLVAADATVAPSLTTHAGKDINVTPPGGVDPLAADNAAGGHWARAVADAPSGGLISGASTDPNAIASANLDTYVGAGATLNSGGSSISVISQANNWASADANSLSLGLGGLGLANA